MHNLREFLKDNNALLSESGRHHASSIKDKRSCQGAGRKELVGEENYFLLKEEQVN